MVDVKTLVDAKISEDTEFQTSLEGLSEEDKEQAISEKREELIKAEFEAIEAKATKAEEIAKNQEIRAKKAEELAKQLKKPEEKETPKNTEYTLQDIRALSDVHDDDVQEVVDFARFKGITIAEAKKNPTIQVLLKNKEEERKTAQATNVGGGKKGTSQITGEDLLEKAMEGEPPLSDEDIEKVVKARLESKIKKS